MFDLKKYVEWWNKLMMQIIDESLMRNNKILIRVLKID